jgi:hypothetical protein
LHCQELSRWARDTITDPLLSPSQSLQKCYFFTKLARNCFDLRDYCTCSAIISGIRSKEVSQLEKHWQYCTDYFNVRKFWMLTETDAALIGPRDTSDPSTYNYLTRIQKDYYSQLFIFGDLYVCTIQGMVDDSIEKKVLTMNSDTEFPILDLTESENIVDRSRIFLRGVSNKHLLKHLSGIHPGIIRTLGSGPLKSVRHFPLLSLNRKDYSFLKSHEELIYNATGFEAIGESIRVTIDYDLLSTGSTNLFEPPRAAKFSLQMKQDPQKIVSEPPKIIRNATHLTTRQKSPRSGSALQSRRDENSKWKEVRASSSSRLAFSLTAFRKAEETKLPSNESQLSGSDSANSEKKEMLMQLQGMHSMMDTWVAMKKIRKQEIQGASREKKKIPSSEKMLFAVKEGKLQLILKEMKQLGIQEIPPETSFILLMAGQVCYSLFI